MKQSRIMSLIEAVVSILVGFGISLTAQAVFLPLLGLQISFEQNLKFALIMTVISIARQFVMRRVFEALHIRRPMSPFMQAVVAECFRQREVEGFDVAHDDAVRSGDLAAAGAVYALGGRTAKTGPSERQTVGSAAFWPWATESLKFRDRRRNYVRGAALIIAEGEKFDRNRKQGRGRS